MELPIAVGQVIAQKYRVDRFIGQGGMGVVVAAFYMELEQSVAIKFLLSESGVQGEGAERFRREARAAAKIHSEHVVRVFDFGLFDERVPYMVMELLHGYDLEQEIEQRGPLPIGEAASFVLQAIDAVAEAHAVGIVHRDLKPTNLFLSQRSDGSRVVKVLDFGISKSLSSNRPREVALTRTAAFVGSPLYMSPEQMRSARDVDARTDIWALGAILYVALTGQLPHPGSSLPEVCVAVMNSSPRPLRDFLPHAPEALEEVLLKCLAKEPSQRYSSVAELAEQLLPFAPECQAIVERAGRLLGGVPHPVSPTAFSRGSSIPSLSNQATPSTQRLSTSTPRVSSPPGATEAPWSKSGRKHSGPRRASLILGALFGITALGALGFWSTRAKEAPVVAASSSLAGARSVPSVQTTPVATEVHAALPAESNTAAAASSAVAAGPLPSSSTRSTPRAPAQGPARPYTYFGGRR
jgi:eukaryotic-like serine/threonine-protein kinase